jgi:hypothetical protein
MARPLETDIPGQKLKNLITLNHMISLVNNRIHKLLLAAGLVVAAVIISMTAGSGLKFEADSAAKTPVAFGSTIHELILTRPIAGLLGSN